MYETLKLAWMIAGMEEAFAGFPEHRKGKNNHYELADAGKGAFSVFFTQSPSFFSASARYEIAQGAQQCREVVCTPRDPQQ